MSLTATSLSFCKDALLMKKLKMEGKKLETLRGGNICVLSRRRWRKVIKWMQGVIKHPAQGHQSAPTSTKRLGAFPGLPPPLAAHHLFTPKDKAPSLLGQQVTTHDWTTLLLRHSRNRYRHLVAIACSCSLGSAPAAPAPLKSCK